MVGGQGQHRLGLAWGHLQPFQPVGQRGLLALLGLLSLLPLPDGVVHVLQRRAAVRGAGIQRRQIVQQDLHGGAVGDDVVHHQRQDVLMGLQPHQGSPGQRPLLQIKGLAHSACSHWAACSCAARACPARHPATAAPACPGVQALLDLPIGPGVEYRAQRTVPFGQALHGRTQGACIQRPGDAQGALHVVGRAARIHLPEKPLALLGRRQRQGHGATGLGQRGNALQRRARLALLAQPVDVLRLVAQPRVLEDPPGRILQGPLPADARGQPHGGQGVAALREEVGLAGRLVQGIATEHLAPQAGQRACGICRARLLRCLAAAAAREAARLEHGPGIQRARGPPWRQAARCSLPLEVRARRRG
jgi:hypothetical protein